MDVTSEIPSVVSLLEQIDTAFGTLYVIIDLANAVLSSSFSSQNRKQFAFTRQRQQCYFSDLPQDVVKFYVLSQSCNIGQRFLDYLGTQVYYADESMTIGPRKNKVTNTLDALIRFIYSRG